MNIHDTHQPSPFHVGETSVQVRMGVQAQIEPWARRIVRPYLPPEHQAFHTSLPFMVVAARDALRRPWVTLLSGRAGFVSSPDPGHLVMDAKPLAGDALSGSLAAGADIGLLGIELATRRRNRMNGTVMAHGPEGITVQVAQSFGNCPQYIQPRDWRRVPLPSRASPGLHSDSLSDAQKAWIRGADTFFIGSGYRGEEDAPSYGLDASHRGGPPGFVVVEGERRLVFPDYAGNNHYNTLGNLVVDDRAGLLFVDFDTGSLLQLSGRAHIDWDSPSVARHPGALRLVEFSVEAVVELPEALPLRFSDSGDAVRSLRLLRKVRESEDVVSLHLGARDGAALPSFEAGQHLPIQVQVPGLSRAQPRTYSLSMAPDEQRYRISVKREPHGVVSRFVHDVLDEGDVISAGTPRGDFVLAHGRRPVVLVSAGVGITPMLSMLHTLCAEDESRPVWFIHGARDGRHHALAREVRALTAGSGRVRSHVSFSRPGAGDVVGKNHDRSGRVDAALIVDLVGDLDADFYLCGPTGFMADVALGLEALGVRGEGIRSETFGPVAGQAQGRN